MVSGRRYGILTAEGRWVYVDLPDDMTVGELKMMYDLLAAMVPHLGTDDEIAAEAERLVACIMAAASDD